MKTEAMIAYEITVEGQLNSHWSEWFDGLTIAPATVFTTVLRGELADQSALFGVLKKIHNLGLPLLSVKRLEAFTKEQSPSSNLQSPLVEGGNI